MVLPQSILDHYAQREGLSDTNLYNFAANYTVVKGRLRKRNSPVVVRTFPCYSSNPHSEQYSQHCKYQLMKYKPWSIDPSSAWMTSHISDGNYTDENIVNAYQEFLEMDVAHLYIPKLAEELNNIQQFVINTS